MDYSMCACHSQLFPLNCELYFKCEVISRKKKRGMFLLPCVNFSMSYDILWTWQNTYLKFKMYNCLITVFEKMSMLLSNIFLQLQMRAPRYSHTFLLSIKLFNVKVAFSSLTMMLFTHLYLFIFSNYFSLIKQKLWRDNYDVWSTNYHSNIKDQWKSQNTCLYFHIFSLFCTSKFKM